MAWTNLNQNLKAPPEMPFPSSHALKSDFGDLCLFLKLIGQKSKPKTPIADQPCPIYPYWLKPVSPPVDLDHKTSPT